MNKTDYRAAMDAVRFREDFQQQTIEALCAAARHPGKEAETMKTKRITKTLLIAAALVLALAVTATAATLLLRPDEVAGELNDATLAAAFAGGDAVLLNQAVESEGYAITLAGMVTGAGLSDFCENLDAARTYVVVSVARTDGTPIVEAGFDFVVTPLVSGYAPHAVNAWTLEAHAQAFTENDVLYYLYDYESLEMFADRTVYLAVYQGFAPSADDFWMADDGSISIAPGMTGPRALFTLPMDEATADPAAVEAYFEEAGINWLLNPSH